MAEKIFHRGYITEKRDWCFATVFSVHSNSAFRVDVDPNVVRRSIIPDVVAGAAAAGTLANVALDTDDGPEAGANTDEMAGVCCWLFTCVLCLSDWAWDSKAFTPNVPSFSVFLQRVQWASKTCPSTGFNHALNVLLYNQVVLNLHFPINLQKTATRVEFPSFSLIAAHVFSF